MSRASRVLEMFPRTETKNESGDVVSRLEKEFKLKLKDGRNVIGGFPFDVDSDEDPSEAGLAMEPVDKDAMVGLSKLLKSKGFKVQITKNKYLIVR